MGTSIVKHFLGNLGIKPKGVAPTSKSKLKGPEKNAIAEGLFNYLRVLCASVVKWVLRKIQ
jgi:hypothetical protein